VSRHRWESYDSVADAYNRVCVPGYEPLARDLVDLVGLEPDAAVLDVGTGTGVVACATARRLERGLLVGVDPSVTMLGLARASTPVTVVAGESPGLPFPARAFDVVLANLVISHVDQYELALADMARVLRPGGRLGVTAWGSLDEDPIDDRDQRELTRIWESVSGRFASLDTVGDRLGAACRHEGWFGDPAHLRAALTGSRLRGVELHGRTYHRDVSLGDALAGYETSFWGRFLHDALSETEWTRFRREVAEEAGRALPDPVVLVDQVLIAVGTKPFDARP